MNGEIVHSSEILRYVMRYLVDTENDPEIRSNVLSELRRMRESGTITHIIFYHMLCALQMHCVVQKNSIDSSLVAKINIMLSELFDDADHRNKVSQQVFGLLCISSGAVGPKSAEPH